MSDPQSKTKNNFLVLRVWKSKKGRSISVTKLLPPTWSYVIVTVLKRTSNEVVLKLEPVKQPIEMDEDRME